MISVLAPHKVYVDYGPMQMTLTAYQGPKGMPEELAAAARYSMELLAGFSAFLPQAKTTNTCRLKDLSHLPVSLQYMVEAVFAAGDDSLTPMAAVAGSFADLTADWLVAYGATKAIVNNGGDIAIRLLGSEKTKIGIMPSIGATQFTHTLELSAQDGIGGVATSGLGGRSFTKGIASSVTVLAREARFADSCATLIANHCNTEDPGILRRPAEELDPDTDIRGHLVTVAVQALAAEKKRLALENGLAKAQELFNQGVIKGAVLFVDEWTGAVPAGLCRKQGDER